MSTVGLLNRDHKPSRAQIKEALAENMCRCCTYQRIVLAVENASKKLTEARHE
jgi:aerobic-type carbon monoxide dehydrogenase small subunit (CoxS/CutS family)